ncbi:hypothetical protein LINPERHAP1_LOCUS31590 [Linum perenne]
MHIIFWFFIKSTSRGRWREHATIRERRNPDIDEEPNQMTTLGKCSL